VNGYLVDTNILSELTRPSPERQVESFLRQSKDRVFVSVFTIGEIRKGIADCRRAIGARFLKTGSTMKSSLGSLAVFCLSRWPSQSIGAIPAQSKAKGRPRPFVDTVLAATAVKHDLILVTRNRRDYQDFSILILNPWEAT
jgi:toxin FitB